MLRNSLLSVPLILSSCYGYEVVGDRVYYKYFSEASGQQSVLVDRADASTFSTIMVDGRTYGRDKFSLYSEYERIDVVDPSTFRVLTKVKYRGSESLFETFYADKLHVFGPDLKVLKGLDPTKFEAIDSDWQHDQKYFVNYGTSFMPADRKTFRIIDDIWARDSTHFYYAGVPLLKADLSSFQRNYYSRSFSRDKTQVFYGSEVVEGADPDSFEEKPGTAYFQDRTYVFDLASKTRTRR
jgi:hypothetical protein